MGLLLAIVMLTMGFSICIGSLWSLVRSFQESEWIWFIACLLLGPVASFCYALFLNQDGRAVGTFAMSAPFVLGLPMAMGILLGLLGLIVG